MYYSQPSKQYDYQCISFSFFYPKYRGGDIEGPRWFLHTHWVCHSLGIQNLGNVPLLPWAVLVFVWEDMSQGYELHSSEGLTVLVHSKDVPTRMNSGSIQAYLLVCKQGNI